MKIMITNTKNKPRGGREKQQSQAKTNSLWHDAVDDWLINPTKCSSFAAVYATVIQLFHSYAEYSSVMCYSVYCPTADLCSPTASLLTVDNHHLLCSSHNQKTDSHGRLTRSLPQSSNDPVITFVRQQWNILWILSMSPPWYFCVSWNTVVERS